MPDRILRTPENRFVGLPGFSWGPQYMDVGGLRIAYLDEGPRDAPVMLLLHGEPSYSFLYRTMIAVLLKEGFRVVTNPPTWVRTATSPMSIGSKQ
jgi:haloalkane dehalogenase